LNVALPARAKLNLDLHVVKRRADGFHEIKSHMQAIALHDLLEASPAGRTTLETDGLAVPGAEDNIVLKAHAALERATARELHTRFHLHKRIPPGAGLGGSSSDAATALKALAEIHGLDVNIKEIAAAIGADVPFFVNGGRALAEGIGEHLTAIPAELEWYAIAWPGIELSTASVYGAWDDNKGEPPNELLKAAERADSRVKEFAEQLGQGWQMTGSGSAFFKRCANRAEGLAAIESFACWTSVTHSVGAWD
jgi:4-diphosphocytidyl-2-C-methyl-D-erythritol kinase